MRKPGLAEQWYEEDRGIHYPNTDTSEPRCQNEMPDEPNKDTRHDQCDMNAEDWAEVYADPDYDLDHDHSMDY